ncbi:MAG TPA: histone deacetylase [Pyrinomonadaceae bacterium]|jgi:acetoin utilization deacetylase AcuC-like enzyme|nr:histone deacetylase [Pyrinomonadaceae bacterium]
MLRVSYTPRYYADIGENHVFPIRKFELACRRLIEEGTLQPAQVVEPQPTAVGDVLLVHTEDYITRLRAGTLTPREMRRLGLPWSKALVRRSFLATGGTINAARWALRDGVGSNLAGGTHHAFADRGEGFCVLNDVAVAIRVLRRDKLISRAGIVDCDVHQGNGTATIFAGDTDVFTFSMHGAKNYPLFKATSSLDVELEDGTCDDDYVEMLAHYLPKVFAFAPDIVFYLAGADPYAGDKLGRLALTIPGLRARDEFVLGACKAQSVPVVTVMSGGYATAINDTVEIHCNTIRAAQNIFDAVQSSRFEAQGHEPHVLNFEP